MSKRLVAALILLCAACDTSLTSPTFTVTGRWTLQLQNVSGSSGSQSGPCAVQTPTALKLVQVVNNFRGEIAGGQLACTQQSGSVVVDIESDSLRNGQVIGSHIAFDLGATGLHFTGEKLAAKPQRSATIAGTFRGQASGLSIKGDWSLDPES